MPPYMYSDRTRGDVDINLDGSFSVPVTLFPDKPGIYTLVAWLKNADQARLFRRLRFAFAQSGLTGRSLACGLEQQDSRRNGNVEGFDGAMHGNPHDLSSASRFNIGKPR